MNNFIKRFIILILLCASLSCMSGVAMEDYSYSEYDKNIGVKKKSWKVFPWFKKTPSKEHGEEESVSPTFHSQGLTLNELDYAAEHEKVTSWIAEYEGRSSLNFNNYNIFSLPNDSKVMEKLKLCKYIDLSHNEISALPDEINKWDSAISLNLSHNSLTIAPWQVFTIGRNVKSCESVTISFLNNPITRIPDEFIEEMMNQRGKRKVLSGFSIEFNQEIITASIVPKVREYPDFKEFLIRSSTGEISNGFCTIQNEYGEFLAFDEEGHPYFSHGHGSTQMTPFNVR